MALGNDLSNEFKVLCSSSGARTEEDYFRNLQHALLRLKKYHVIEIHGGRCQVTYTETMGWFSKSPRCELGDLFFLVYSPKRNKARYFVMQNKVRKRNYKRVNADLVQFELLSKRLKFTYVRDGKVSNLLSAARHESVSVYGNFYKDTTGQMDMATFTANQLQFVRAIVNFPLSSLHPKRVVEYKGVNDTLTSIKTAKRDFYGTDCLIHFGNLMEELHIGEPLNSGLKEALLAYFKGLDPSDYESNMSQTLEGACEQLESIVVEEFNARQELEDQIEDYKNIKLCRNIQFINVDEL